MVIVSAIPGIQGSVSLERFDRRFITFNFRGQGNAQLLFQAHETIEDKDVFLVSPGPEIIKLFHAQLS